RPRPRGVPGAGPRSGSAVRVALRPLRGVRRLRPGHTSRRARSEHPRLTSPSLTAMTQAERPVLRRWTRHEYERLIDHGFLDEDARSGLRLARGRKAAAYARAGIADYWIVDLVDRLLEVHREPARPGPARRHWGYAAIETLGADATITPLSAPSAGIRVSDLLP